MPCDLSCKTKIIINGDNVARLAETLCEQIEYFRDNDLPFDNGDEIIDALNHAEDAMCKAQRLFIKGQGWNGPLGKMLS